MLLHLTAISQDALIENPLPENFKRLERYNENIQFNFGSIQVYALCTGYISTSGEFPEPVFVWLIKSPSGNYLIDGGLSPLITNKNYFKGISKGFFKKEFRFFIYKKNYLPAQLLAHGVSEANLKAIILTHAHFDHIGYLPFFKNVPVILSAGEKNKVVFWGQLGGYQKHTREMINFKRVQAVAVRNRESKKINDDLTLIKTGEHTKGHIMVILATPKEKVLFTGDINLKKLDHNSILFLYLNKLIDINKDVLFFNHNQELE